MCWSTPLPAFLPWHTSGSSGVDITPVMLWSGSVSPAAITAFCKDCRRYYMNNPPPATQRAVLFWLRVPQLYKTPAHTVPVRHSQGLLSCCSSSRLWSSLLFSGDPAVTCCLPLVAALQPGAAKDARAARKAKTLEHTLLASASLTPKLG